MEKLEIVRNKILNNGQLSKILSYWHFKNLKLAFTNGCFDLIHRGHVDYLSKAKDLTDILIVGLNSDASVKHLKGQHRPINDEYSRALVLASFSFVDAVILFDEETPYELIKTIQPDFLIKGNDYKPEDIVGYDIVKAKGCKVLTLEYLSGFSTSSIEKKILNNVQENNLL